VESWTTEPAGPERWLRRFRPGRRERSVGTIEGLDLFWILMFAILTVFPRAGTSFHSQAAIALNLLSRRGLSTAARKHAFTMPKIASDTLPVAATFGVVKPSGPTSMSIVNDIKKLARKSRLFLAEAQANTNRESGKKPKRRGKHNSSEEVKMGQGGTLDPLADGVLGASGRAFLCVLAQIRHENRLTAVSQSLLLERRQRRS
jgi:hypothetical protein